MPRLSGGYTGGFTLMELIAVMVVIGVLSVVAMAGSIPGGVDALAEAEVVKAHLRFTQGRAMNDTVDWQLVFTANGYSLQKADGGAVPPLPGETGPAHAFDGVTCATPQTVGFDEWGSPGGATIALVLNDGQNRTVTITRNTGFIP